jgi:hypothetical protein
MQFVSLRLPKQKAVPSWCIKFFKELMRLLLFLLSAVSAVYA